MTLPESRCSSTISDMRSVWGGVTIGHHFKVTSPLTFEDWTSALQSKRLTCALLERLASFGFWAHAPDYPFLARIRCKVRRCMLRRRAVSETLRPYSSKTR